MAKVTFDQIDSFVEYLFNQPAEIVEEVVEAIEAGAETIDAPQEVREAMEYYREMTEEERRYFRLQVVWRYGDGSGLVFEQAGPPLSLWVMAGGLLLLVAGLALIVALSELGAW